VVTQARDLSRAIWSFERVGLRALPWPAPHTPLNANRIEDFLPDVRSFQASFSAVHELLGILYYRLRYWRSQEHERPIPRGSAMWL